MSPKGSRCLVWAVPLCIVLLCLVPRSLQQSESSCKNVKHKVDCGCPSITEADCKSRGCCYDKSSSDFKCFFPDVNKCLSNNGGCSPDAKCKSQPGTVTCKCNPGFKGDGYKCKDVDECATNNGGCSWDAQCINTPGSSFCACKVGFSEIGFSCSVAANIALRKPAWQISSHTAPGLAVDGNLNPSYPAGSCSLTGGEINPWWAVDLGGPYFVDGILLTNRGDCCGENMNNFFVGLTNNLPHQYPPINHGYTLCGQWPGVAHGGQTLPVKCASGLHPARYIVVMNQKPNLAICELQAFGKVAHNIAFLKTTWQSSTHEGHISSRAVDGNENQNPGANSCSITSGGDINPWWAVDLAGSYKIHSVILSNRNDQGFRMDYFKVGLSNNPPYQHNPSGGAYNYTLCGQYNGIAPNGYNLPVTCTPGLPAFRFVIVMTHRASLSICELQVFRTPEEPNRSQRILHV